MLVSLLWDDKVWKVLSQDIKQFAKGYAGLFAAMKKWKLPWVCWGIFERKFMRNCWYHCGETMWCTLSTLISRYSVHDDWLALGNKKASWDGVLRAIPSGSHCQTLNMFLPRQWQASMSWRSPCQCISMMKNIRAMIDDILEYWTIFVASSCLTKRCRHAGAVRPQA